MSADNWTQCPNCTKDRVIDREATLVKAEKRASEAYGVVSAVEYAVLAQDVSMAQLATESNDLNDTFREDYEFRMSLDGKFEVTYHGKCAVCDFTHVFAHNETINLSAEEY